MAGQVVVQLLALRHEPPAPYPGQLPMLTVSSCILSFGHVSQSLGRHSLTERPRLSWFVVLLLSGGLCLAASVRSRWLSGAYGRFASGHRRQSQDKSSPPLLGAASNEALLDGSSCHLPRRPKRYSLPALIFCVALRLEIFHRISYRQQCASPGIQSFLCLLLIGYEIYSNRRRWGVPPTEDDDDPWRSVFDDIYDWFSGPRVTMVIMYTSAGLFSLGTYLATGQITRSTYICFGPIDSRPLTLLLQVVGLVLNATIIVLLWRILAWTRTARMRLRVLGGVLVLSALSTAGLWLASILLSGSRRPSLGFGSLHGFDYLADSVALATFVVSAAFWVCETSPITPASVVTFLVGTWISSLNVVGLGDWMHVSRVASLLPVWLIAFGTVLFTYTHDLRFIVFFRRSVLTFLFMVLLIVATVVTCTRQPETFDKRHPVNDLIFDAQIRHTRWLLKAATSQSLPVAVKVYQERHSGRAPPPNFAEWYQYASGSPVIDEFNQIDQDLAPFWEFTPADLRKRVDAMAAHPGVGEITVKKGEVTKSDTGDDDWNIDLDELVGMIKKFSRHLPDMVLPINLGPTPRILPSWRDFRLKDRADMSYVVDLISKRWLRDSGHPLEARNGKRGSSTSKQGLVPASNFRQMQIEACSAMSRARTRPHWDFGQFCSECAKGHSQGQLLSSFDRLLDVCNQPDLKHLHSFSLADARSPPIRQFVPLFSASKTDDFRDIIIPLPRSRLEMPDTSWQFSRRFDNLFWRASIGDGAINGRTLRGSHKFRLLHLIKSPDPQDEISMILPVPVSAAAAAAAKQKEKEMRGVEEKEEKDEEWGRWGRVEEEEEEAKEEEPQFRTEKVSAAEASRALPFSIGINNYSACVEGYCQVVKHAFGTEADTEEALEYRYVLLTDEDDGPPAEMLRTIRSGSVPFISTIFRTWYTERLQPWLHFVPIDVRYQGLHTTFSYFTGTEKRPRLNGRDTALKGRTNDAEWISQRGRNWAEAALAKKDMEIYLFRLLLEWGRLIDERRGEIGYGRGRNGEDEKDRWTRW